jgi:hypothetical protein
VLGIGFVVAALVNVLRGWRQDLVEARRKLRAAILVSSGACSIAIMSVELVLRGRPPSAEILLLNAVLLAALLLGLACLVLDIGPSVRSAFGWTPPPAATQVEPAHVVARNREQEIIERLQELMTQDAAYRDATIAIASLASRLGVTEKKLRELINGQLGCRNFSSCVNAFSSRKCADGCSIRARTKYRSSRWRWRRDLVPSSRSIERSRTDMG